MGRRLFSSRGRLLCPQSRDLLEGCGRLVHLAADKVGYGQNVPNEPNRLASKRHVLMEPPSHQHGQHLSTNRLRLGASILAALGPFLVKPRA